MGNPLAEQFDAGLFAKYRTARLEAGISTSCVNREHAYLRAVFNELRRIGVWEKDNPLELLRQFKVPERELSFLPLDDIEMLLGCLSGDALMVAKICLATGARWSEAEGLRGSQVHGGQVHYSGTKSGKNRSVPVDDVLFEMLDKRSRERMGRRLFVSCYEAFRRGVSKCGLVLPRGQLTHVLRHTFASHFMMNGGNILALQRILD